MTTRPLRIPGSQDDGLRRCATAWSALDGQCALPIGHDVTAFGRPFGGTTHEYAGVRSALGRS